MVDKMLYAFNVENGECLGPFESTILIRAFFVLKNNTRAGSVNKKEAPTPSKTILDTPRKITAHRYHLSGIERKMMAHHVF